MNAIEVFNCPPPRRGEDASPVDQPDRAVLWPESLEVRADRYYECRESGGRLVARCALWDGGGGPGRIGHYAAVRCDAGAAVLERAAADAAKRGIRELVGPMNGSTWRSHRFIIERGERPAFLFEPDHPDRYVADWHAAGFEPIAEYISAWCDDTSRRDPRLNRVRQRLGEAGLRIRPIDVNRFDRELEAIHALSLDAFAENYLYTPIDLAAFQALYEPLRERIVPDLVLLAERNDELVGYAFTIPDYAQAARGQAVDTLIVKTVAVRPGRQSAGLGQLLMEEAQLAGRRLGLRHAIHAFMHASNISTRMSGHYATPFRRYALFGRRTGA